MADSRVLPDGPVSELQGRLHSKLETERKSIEELCEGLLASEPARAKAIKRLQTFLEDESATELDLEDLELEALPGAYFADPRVTGKLERFFCSKNRLEELPPELGTCVRLEQLTCNENGLQEIPRELGFCVRLNHLFCSYNQLEELPSELGLCINLKVLYCHDNQLQKLPPTLTACVKLEELYCGNNQLRELPQEMFRLDACINLKSIYCGNNQLEELPFELGACAGLKQLNCDDNPLKEGTPRTIGDLREQWAQRPHTKRAENE